MTPWILLPVLVGGGLIAAGVWYFARTFKRLKTELADFIAANPESAAVAAYTCDANGDRVEDAYALFHNADRPLVVASTMKVVVLAAYADAVAAGELDPNERIPVTDVEKYYLPTTDGGAHAQGLKSLRLAVDAHGFARGPAAAVSLDDLARIMIHYSGNAETDYLLERIRADRMAAVMRGCALDHHTPIAPILGATLAIFNHENWSVTDHQLQRVLTDVSNGDTRSLNRLMELYLHDPKWRAAQIEYMTSDKDSSSVNEQEVWAYHVEASQLLPRGTAREYARLMARIASGRLISPEASAIMQQKLEGVPSDWPLRILFYNRFGAKDGVTAGVLALTSYAVPSRGPLAGQSRVVVVLTNHLPPKTWSAQLQYQGHYLLQTDLARASGVYNRLARAD